MTHVLPTHRPLDRFTRLLDAHGPEPSRWPARDRAAAEALLANSAAARALLAEARALEARLVAALPQPAPEAVARLQANLARAIARSPLPAPASAWTRLTARLRPAAPIGWGAFAAMATCALWLSFSAGPAVGDPLGPLQALPIAEDPL
ncbi:hypothetical protein [Roseicella aquatilis]|uniref:Uncharacterized protein n=1 Tax=Roseicella aquatilis TaxID=2527868 RepID=A0A4V2WJK9_9PROT|nr:hypothetical protein [Roseicella aquatilis]TCZ54972.1 hypothetical protein EXY23_22475 [Roseicella aquatilis]